MKSKVCADKECQATKYYKEIDKNCQTNVNMRPRKLRSDRWSVTNTDNVQLPKPAVPYGYSRLCKDKDCQSTRCYKKRNYDKNCQ